jgi:hypothetical protein
MTTQSPEEQLVEMEEWFRSTFEDPVETTPYESAEGGYQYIWGGPYHASDELHNKFHGRVQDELIDQLAEKLDEELWDWAPVMGGEKCPQDRDDDD